MTIKRQKFLLAGVLLLSAGTLLQPACTKKRDVSVPVPVITGVNKTAALIGDTLIITGSQFSATPGNDLVAIAGVSLDVLTATTTQLSAVIPAGTLTGQLTVALPQGRSATYPDSIFIGVPGAPYITSITPAIAYTGDTIVLHGGNFVTPAVNTSVSMTGTPCKVINVSDTVIRLVVADPAYTGNVIVTSNGLTSAPYHYTVQKIDPLADGRFYWMNPVTGPVPTPNGPQSGNPGTIISRGNDSANKPPYSSIAFQDGSSQLYPNDNSGAGANLFGSIVSNPIVGDAQGNFYYMNIITTYFQGNGRSTYSVKKLTPSLTGYQVATLWSETPDPTTYSYYIPDGFTYLTSVPDIPQSNIGIDGNRLYIKIGIRDSFLTADVSVPSPVFTPLKGLVADSVSLDLQFTPNYIFYEVPGSTNGQYANAITVVRYMQRGSNTSQAIPFPAGITIVRTMADVSHGDNILIFGRYGDIFATSSYDVFYRFNAATQTLTKLYDPSNWTDAGAFTVYNPSGLTTAVYWAGSHIYYADKRRSYTQSLQFGGNFTETGLYRLNDDGSSTKPYNVYPRLEPLSFGGPAPLYLFIGSK